jgi:hypothetical protein
MTEKTGVEFFWGWESSISHRVKFFLTGALFPSICILVALSRLGSAATSSPWQSGTLEPYAVLLLQWPAIGPFLPLIIFHMACLTLWLIRPRFGGSPVIAFGIGTGIITALEFWLFILCTSSVATVVAAIVVGPALAVVVFLAAELCNRAKRFSIRHLLLLTTGCAFVALLAKYFLSLDVVLGFLAVTLLGVLAATPTLNLITYIRATYELLQQLQGLKEFSERVRVIGSLSFLFAWLGTWKFAIDLVIAEYAMLPTRNPSCYVSAAAAYGHSRFVGAEPPTSASPRPRNMQMRRLKFLEFAMAAALPRVHRFVRAWYDRLGPPLAATCRQNVWFADTTYVLLKPLEGLAEVLRILIGISRSRIREL